MVIRSSNFAAIRRVLAFLLIAISLNGLATRRALADASFERTRLWYVTLYGDVFAQTVIYTLPVDIVDGDLKTKRAYYFGGSVGYALIPSLTIPVPFCTCSLKGFSLELEGQTGHHFGLQDHFESDLTLLLRTPEIALPGGFSVNFAGGEGLSYAYTLPKLEGSVAAEGPYAAGPRRFLNYLGFESELTQIQLPGVHVLLNIHHRSGVYGLIAPHKTGANYIGGGLRFDL